MHLHLSNADIVLMIALALLGTLIVAIRFRPRHLALMCIEALIVDALAVGAVIAFETLPLLFV
jgi:hypothetical protein